MVSETSFSLIYLFMDRERQRQITGVIQLSSGLDLGGMFSQCWFLIQRIKIKAHIDLKRWQGKLIQIRTIVQIQKEHTVHLGKGHVQ